METFTSFVENGDYGRLNPYCNGRYSWRFLLGLLSFTMVAVLILIIMEDTHGVMLGFKDGTKALLS